MWGSIIPAIVLFVPKPTHPFLSAAISASSTPIYLSLYIYISFSLSYFVSALLCLHVCLQTSIARVLACASLHVDPIQVACPHNCPNLGDLTINGPKCVVLFSLAPNLSVSCWHLDVRFKLVCVGGGGGFIVSLGLAGSLHTFQNVSLGDSGVEPVMFSQEKCIHHLAYLHSSFPKNTKAHRIICI